MKKRILSGLLCLVLVFTVVCHGMTPAEADGAVVISSSRCRTLLQHTLGLITVEDDLMRIADFNCDGRVNTADVRDMLIANIRGVTSVEDPGDGFRLSSISDKTNSSRTASYIVVAPNNDTYTLSCSNASSIVLSRHGTTVASGARSLSVSLKKNAAYTLTITTTTANASFSMTAQGDAHYITLPYDVAEPMDTSGIELYSNTTMAVKPAELNYVKRPGGTYIYSNNPEKILSDAVGKAFIRNKDLSGEVFFTFEHINMTSSNIYLGYQLKNEGTTDVFVTVTNIGYQTSGDWYGREAWSKFYNMEFKLPSSYNNTGFSFSSYNPRVFQPITYRLPVGKPMYVIGGTSSDAYNNINIDGTANQAITPKSCANGTVKFHVTGGAVTGAFYCYRYTSQVAAEPAMLGYRTTDYYTSSYGTDNYGVQYIGTGDHSGVIDNYASWTFNDTIGAGTMPVTYTNYYDENYADKTTPYAQYNCTPHTVKTAYSWATHINPHASHVAVGTDMVEFTCVDDKGRNVVISTKAADSTGDHANLGNWMIEYQDHFTFVNQGNRTRTLNLNLRDHGALSLMVRNSDGSVIEATQTVGKSSTYDSAALNYQYSVTVPPHSVKQITLQYTLIAQSYGNVNHSVSILS